MRVYFTNVLLLWFLLLPFEETQVCVVCREFRNVHILIHAYSAEFKEEDKEGRFSVWGAFRPLKEWGNRTIS